MNTKSKGVKNYLALNYCLVCGGTGIRGGKLSGKKNAKNVRALEFDILKTII